MNWTAMGVVAMIVVQLAALVILQNKISYFAGQLTEAQKQDAARISGIEITQVVHADRINRNEVDIAKLQAWRDGYEASSRNKPQRELAGAAR